MIGPWEFVIVIVSRSWRSLKQGGKGFVREIRGKDELPPPPSNDA